MGLQILKWVNLKDKCEIINLKVSKPKRQVWDYKSADFNGLNATLSNAPFETAYTIFYVWL